MKKNKIVCTKKAAKFLLLFAFSVLSVFLYSQDERKYVKEGNKLYEQKKYSSADSMYRKALSKSTDTSYRAQFNLGDALYKQNKFTEAAEKFEMLANKKTDKLTQSKAYHNLGNCHLKERKWEKSIEAYKNALKNNPIDEDSRYNLSYAQKMLVQQQKNDKDKDKNEDDKKDQDKKEKDNDKQEKENKDKEKPDKQPEQKQEISKEDAQRLLDALQQNEKDIQEKLKKQKNKGVKVEVDKDW